MADRPEVPLRPDIQALRAIAVGSVLLFHLWPDRLAGGYVGVDVFFAISGFLITSHLVREVERTGTLRLGSFWARRAKRLLPASLLVLLATTIAILTVVSVGERSGFLREVLGSTFYVENWVLAREAVDYLASDDAASPVRHFWTLSVEEQFYVGVPLVILVTAFVARRAGAARPARWIAPVLAVLAVASLVYSVTYTVSEPSVAYFSTGTRAWEFALGGLVGCLLARPGVDLRRSAATVLGWGGLAAIVAAIVLYDAGTAFPGYAAALPVLGACAAVAAGGAGPLGLLGRVPPVRFVGDISYATYLWHWPMIVVLPYATGHDLTNAEKVAIGALTLLLAWASTRFVEDPVRFSPRLLGAGRSPLTVGLVCAAAMLVVAGTAHWGGERAESRVVAAQQQAEGLVAGTDIACLGAGTVVNRHPDRCPDLGDAVVPAPEAAAHDDHNRVDCWATNGVSDPHVCRLAPPGPGPGPRDGIHALAVGDSHNNVYLPLYESLAADHGWTIDVTGKAGCSWGTRPQTFSSPTAGEQCATWKRRITDRLAAGPAYDVILTTSLQTGALAEPEGDEDVEEATLAGVREAWESQIARGTKIIAIRDNPIARPDVLTCVEQHGIEARTACAVPRRAAFAGYDALAAAVAVTPGSALVSMRDLICARRECAPVVGNVAVYRDPSHMTATFVRTVVPILTQRILRTLDEMPVA